MLETSSRHSRLLFVCALTCAAVMPFIMCSDAAAASLKKNQVNTERHIVRRRLYTPNSQHRPLFSGLPSLQTGANGETEKSGNYGGASSIIYHQSNPPRSTESSFSYNNNIPDNRPSRAGTTSVKSGMSPASSYRPLSYNSYPVINRKASYKEAASPFHQSSSPPEVWGAKEAHRSYIKEKVPKNNSPSHFSSQTGRYRSLSRPTSRGLYSGYKETNERSSAGAQRASSGILLSKFSGLASQTAPRAPSIGSSSVIKSIPSPEKLTPSITDFSQGLHSASGSETPRLKNIKSYLFKDSQPAFGGHETVQTVPDKGPHKQRASKVPNRFSSNVKRLQLSQRKDPTKNIRHLSDNANPLHHNNNNDGAHYGAQTDGFAKYTARHTARVSAPGKDGMMGSNYAAGSSKSVVSGISDATTRGSMHASTPGQAIKNTYGFRRLENSKWRAAKKPPVPSSSGSNERTNSGRSSFDKGKGSKITNANLPLSQKYSFGRREASATRAKPERTPTKYSAPSPGTHQDLASGFKEARPRLPDRNPDHRLFKTHKRIYGFKAFGPRSLEAAKTSVSEPDESARVQQGLVGFKLRSPQFWQPKSSRINTMSRTEPSSEDHKPLLKTAGSAESVSKVTLDEYKNKHKIDTLLGLPSIQNRIENADDDDAHKQNQESHRISSAYLRSAGEPDTESRLKSEPGTPDVTELFAKMASLLNSSTTSSTGRGRAKTLNESAPIDDAAAEATVRVVAIAYADILGSASFRGVAATTQTPTDKDDFPNTSAAAEQKEGAGYLTLNSEDAVRSGDNTSRGPDDVEANKMAVGSEEVDDDTRTFDFFLDNEGSGSGGFDVSDVFSTATTKSQGLSEDLSELEYLRISTGNISFKSMTLSHTEP